MLLLALLLALIVLISADGEFVCTNLPRPPVSPTLIDSVYFLFVIDNSWPTHKIAQQKALYQMIACEIPRSPKFLVGTIYAYAPKRPADFALDEKSLATADRFTATLDDVVERSYLTRAKLPYDRSRCSRMHAVVEVMRLADFSYDTSVHTHYIFPTDDSEDDFVNDCDPALTFKQSARNILKEATPNHIYLDVIRIGAAKRWTQYGERVQLADWSDRSINQRDVSHLFSSFLDGALTGEAGNDAILYATNGLERNERPKDVMTFVTIPPPPPSPPSTTTSISTSTTTKSASTTTTSLSTTTEEDEEIGRKVAAAAGAATEVQQILTADAPRGSVPFIVHKKRGRPARGLGNETDDGVNNLNNATSNGKTNGTNTNDSDKHVMFGIQFPVSTTLFYVIVVATTAGTIVLVWIVCALVFYCCYRDDDSIKKHNKKVAEEEEDEMMLISGLSDEDYMGKPSTIMVSDHLRKVKEERYNEEQLKSSETRGSITIEA